MGGYTVCGRWAHLASVGVPEHSCLLSGTRAHRQTWVLDWQRRTGNSAFALPSCHTKGHVSSWSS